MPPPHTPPAHAHAHTHTLTRPQAKFDLVAAGNVQQAHPEWGVWGAEHGHKPCVALGARFRGRGWLQAAGVHMQYYNGIQTG